jgi:hypothetical protein
MFAALKARPVKGCTATVCEVDPAVKEIKVNKILNFNIFHNFSFEKNGLRTWKAFEVGSGQLLSWRTLHVQFPASNISAKPVSEGLDFWDVLQEELARLEKKNREGQVHEVFSQIALKHPSNMKTMTFAVCLRQEH